MAIGTFPKFSGTGRTASLLDEQLILLGNDDLGTKAQYLSIQRPRDGLLAMKYTVEELPLAHSAHEHASLVSGNTLSVVGGKFKSKGKLSTFTWTELSLRWENGSKYTPAFINSCSVKLDADVHFILGGGRMVNGERVSVSEVVKINTTEEIAYELEPITHSRVFHACQVLNENVILVSGGFPHKGDNKSILLPDELYNITSGKVIKVIELKHSVRRAQHALAKTGTQVLAFGGVDKNNKLISKIAGFNATINAWTSLSQELLSTNTSNLMVTAFPTSALDCVPQCRCGTTEQKGRIFGGTEAEVIISIQFFFQSF